MKNLIFGLLLIATQVAFANGNRIYLENTDTADLQSDLAKLNLMVSYPMAEISGVCSLDIVADSYNRVLPIKSLLDQVEFQNFFSKQSIRPVIVSDTVLRVNLAPSYVDGIIIRTKGGNSLKEAIGETLGADRKVVVMPRSCH